MTSRTAYRTILTTLAAVLVIILGCAPSVAQTLQLCDAVGNETDEHPQMFAGSDGWVFTAPNLRDDIAFEPTLPYLERLTDSLAQHGTQLVIVLVPTRGMVHEDRFPDRLPDNLSDTSMTEARSQYRELRSSLEAMGIIAPDILETALDFRGPEGFFFKLDHHWVPAAARAAARTTAEAIREGSSIYPSLEKTEFETEIVGATLNQGSYWRILTEVCGIELEDEPLDRFRTALADGGAEDLFSDLTTDVVLVGTSYSKRSVLRRDYNFSGFLSQFLSLNIANEAVGGGGPYGAAEIYLVDGPRPFPRLVVWEIPIRRFPNLAQFRQLAPAVDGACTPEDALATAELSLGTPELGGPALDVDLPPAGGFLFFEFDNTEISSFDVGIVFDNDAETYPIRRSQRLTNQGRFFLDLADRGEATLQTLSILRLPDGTDGKVALRICPLR